MKLQFTALILWTAIFCGIVYSQSGQKQLSDAPEPCRLKLNVKGAQFVPTECRFEVIDSGVECRSGTGCPPAYTFSMKDRDRTHIQEVVLSDFKSLEKKTYRFDKAKSRDDFKAQLLDDLAAARNLLKGEVSLEPKTARNGQQVVKISLDLSFANGIHLEGSGEAPVKRVAAP